MAKQESAGDVQQVIRNILSYLLEHPDAKDTLDGIMRWWGDPLHRAGAPDRIREGLEELAMRGWISVRTGGTGVRLYGLNKDCMNDIRRYLHG